MLRVKLKEGFNLTEVREVFNYTKGKTYEAIPEEDCHIIIDDLGNREKFFNINIIFEKI